MKNKIKNIYLDHAAATPVDALVLKAMKPYFSTHFANPSALHQPGVEANQVLTQCRQTIAGLIFAQPDEIIFTSGGTEANNLAVFGVVSAFQNKNLTHIITTPIEHHSVLEPINQLKKQGVKVTYLKVNLDGIVNPADVIRAIRSETVLISVMMANNEIGIIEPIAEIGRLLLKYKKIHNTQYPYFFTDACQAAGYLDINVLKLHVDLLSVNAAKIYGPKGAGFLFVKRGTKFTPMFYGGQQEFGVRAGTENLSAIVGLAKALDIIKKTKNQENKKTRKLSETLFKKIKHLYPKITLNGPPIGDLRLPNNLNINFPGLDAETLSIYLDSFGVYCATGSACTTDQTDTSYVIKAIHKQSGDVKSSLRFSLGNNTSLNDINYVADSLKKSLKLMSKQ